MKPQVDLFSSVFGENSIFVDSTYRREKCLWFEIMQKRANRQSKDAMGAF